MLGVFAEAFGRVAPDEGGDDRQKHCREEEFRCHCESHLKEVKDQENGYSREKCDAKLVPQLCKNRRPSRSFILHESEMNGCS